MRRMAGMAVMAGSLVLASPVLAQSPYGYVGSSNSAPYLGFVGGGGGPYVVNYGTFVIGVPQPVIRVVQPAPVIVINQISQQRRARQRAAHDACAPVVLTVPTGPFKPFAACPAGGESPQLLRQTPGAKIIRITDN